MAFDPSQIQLPPHGTKLRLPPKILRQPTYAEVCQIVRRHLNEEEAESGLTVHIQGHRTVYHADSAGVRAGD